jgi:hypothetical protein
MPTSRENLRPVGARMLVWVMFGFVVVTNDKAIFIVLHHYRLPSMWALQYDEVVVPPSPTWHYRLFHSVMTRVRYAMRREGTSYPCPLLRLTRGAVVETEARHRPCFSLAVVVEAGIVLKQGLGKSTIP